MKTLLPFSLCFLLFPSLSNAQTEWIKHSENPIISETPGTWDAIFVAFGTVIQDTVYKMWYTGGLYYPFADAKIGFATSIDGINWDKRPDPVFTRGEAGKFDEGTVAGASVLFDEGVYKMWYFGTRSDFTNNWRIGYATSPDGVNWTRQNDGNAVLDLGAAGEWDDAYVGHFTVIRDDSQLKMWYRGTRSPGASGSIGLATSTDGVTWTKYPENPVLTGTPGTWDATVVNHPNVILNNSTYEMWYGGQGNTGVYNVGYATSSDGVNWTKSASNPVMTVGSTASFDSHGLLKPSVIFENDTYKMWYTGNRSTIWRIGYAVSDLSAVDIELTSGLPEVFSLEPNYPNPFNPSTVIRYSLPVGRSVIIRVYDMIGREVATLVNEYKPAGRYEIQLDASQLPSGAYIYRLVTGEYAETRKMLLIR
jgi:predicted GH43/DUF377 family glycosyl hydrolase